ncbi:MAG: phage terminase large subunit family protein, partial [Patescibacteria group bacterium]|nr:phage terminase large subunit family protein [Patescibacteria group bacterium]
MNTLSATPLLDALAQWEEKQAPQAAADFAEWALAVPEPKFGTLDFELFPFQRELYSQEVAELEECVMVKSTQVGASALAWRWAAWRTDCGDTVLYVFPSSDHVTDFGDTRIDPAIEESTMLAGRVGEINRKQLKQIGDGTLYLRGSNSRAGAQSVDADAIIFDEYNDLDQGNVSQFERRISGSRQAGRVPRVRRLGIPTGPGEGIDVHWQQSDQRRWHVTCGECGFEQSLEWGRNVRWRNTEDGPVLRPGTDVFGRAQDVHEAWRVCARCEASLEGAVGAGRWLATQESPLRGYHIPRLIVPSADLKALVTASRKTRPSEVIAFFNNDLGVPYAPTDASLDEESILAACARGGEIRNAVTTAPGFFRTAGIDVASERDLNVRVSELLPDGTRKAIWIGVCADFDEAAALLQRLAVTQFCVDSNPERRLGRALCARFPGMGVLCEYSGPDSSPFDYRPERGVVRVNRTEAIDAMMDSIRFLRNLPLREPPPGYVEHLKALRRRATVDK